MSPLFLELVVAGLGLGLGLELGPLLPGVFSRILRFPDSTTHSN